MIFEDGSLDFLEKCQKLWKMLKRRVFSKGTVEEEIEADGAESSTKRAEKPNKKGDAGADDDDWKALLSPTPGRPQDKLVSEGLMRPAS